MKAAYFSKWSCSKAGGGGVFLLAVAEFCAERGDDAVCEICAKLAAPGEPVGGRTQDRAAADAGAIRATYLQGFRPGHRDIGPVAVF